ncbi:MAG: hypothetical protein ACLS3M_08275 [Collinsella sp.]
MPGKVVAIVCTAIWVALMAKKGPQVLYLATSVAPRASSPTTTSPLSDQWHLHGCHIAMIAYPIIFAIWKFFTSALPV